MNQLNAKWKIYNESGKWQVHKLNPDGTQGEAIGPAYEKREGALAYQRALYKNVPDVKESTEDESVNTNLVLGAVTFIADELNPRILKFENVVLARPETNKNRDNVDDKGIAELAQTISGCPIDVDHDVTHNVGMFTAGRVGEKGELRVDGIVWLDRCEAMGVDPDEVKKNLYKMSVEADADYAECSICHSRHENSSTYCSHIVSLRAKIRNGAERVLKGLRALGGALTKRPAGTETGWDAYSGIVMVAHQKEMDMENEVEESIEKREDVSPADKKRAESEYGDVKYADEENKKYPIDTEEHVRAALAYLSMPKNSGKYSSEEVAKMMSKIKHAAKKFGIEVSEPKNKEEAMDEKELEATKEEETVETPADEKKESPEKEKEEVEKGEEKDMKAEYEAMKANLADMTAKFEKIATEKAELESKLQASEQQLTEARTTLKAHRVAELKTKLVATVLDESEFEAKVETLLDLPNDVIDLMTRNIKPTERTRMQAATEETTVTKTWKF